MFKNLSKYNFTLLLRNNNFYTDRTIMELSNICHELNYIYNTSVKIFEKSIFCYKNLKSPNPDQKITRISNNLEFFLN
jgi:hypothetical protein